MFCFRRVRRQQTCIFFKAFSPNRGYFITYKTMVRIWILCATVLMFRDSILSHFSDLQSGQPEDDLFELRDEILNRGIQQIARLNGDLKLGAMLPIHLSSAKLCSRLYVDGILLVEAIVFALREIKYRKLLPEEITLGYEIRDTCNSVIVAQRHTLDIVIEAMKYEGREYNMNENNDSTLSYYARDYNHLRNGMTAVVGAGNSEISVAVNRLLSAFNIPQIGFASTSRFLSEKLRFPSFFRTVPPDTNQVQALAALFERFSWNYAGVLVSDGEYGRPLADAFKSSVKEKEVCITYEHLVPFHVSLENAKSIVRVLNSKTNIEIVVILLPEPDMETLLLAMLEVGLTNKTLIASDSWSKAVKDLKFSNIVAGTLGFAHDYTPVKEFEDYFLSLKPNTNTWNLWFNETWEHVFDCVLPKTDKNNVNKNTSNSRKIKTFCDLERQHFKREHFTRFHYVSNIVDAVFAVAKGIDTLYKEQRGTAFSLTPHELLNSLKQITFQRYNGENITFDENGDVMGKYNLVNINPGLKTKCVGIWNGENLKLRDSERIWWNTAERIPPKGICAVPCSAGSYQHTSKADPQCCWTCHPCHAGTITNRSGATKCIPCPEDHMTNFNQTACIFIPLNYLDWQSFWTVSIVILALISVFILLFIVILFIRYVNTPVVKSSNRELSLLLGIGLFLTFLVPFAFAGKPTKLKCIISQVMFCVGCALALSAMLFRTLRIVLLFGFINRRRWLLKNKYQIAMTLSLTFAELIYCLLWVAVKPPGVKATNIRPTKRYLVCKFDRYWYGGSHLLLIFLSVVCTILAVKGRKLPKNFNEVRYIGLSMFTFNIIWVVFMCAQYGASLEYDVKINCFAMITSSLVILVLLFGPKVFILLFRAHLNKKEEFEAEVRRYSFKLSNGKVSNSVTSLRQGSSITFRTGNLFNDQFLSVASDDLSRMRSHSFDAMASRLYQNRAYSLRKSCSKETQTDFPSDLSKSLEIPVIVSITKERKFSDSSENDSNNLIVVNDEKMSESYYDTDLEAVANCKGNTQDECQDLKLNTNGTSKFQCDCSNELEHLLKDLDVPNENRTRNSFTESLTRVPNDEKIAFPIPKPNAKGDVEIDDSMNCGKETLQLELKQDEFLENDLHWNNDSKRIKVKDHRNELDRETVL